MTNQWDRENKVHFQEPPHEKLIKILWAAQIKK